MTQKRSLFALALVLLALSAFNTYQGLHNASQLTGTVKASAATRVTTVKQRCALTQLDSKFASDAAVIIGEFAPQAIGPFRSLQSQFLSSYAGCEKQLVEVERINAHAP